MKRMLLLLLFGYLPGASACSYPQPSDFTEVVRSSDTIAVVRVLSQRATDRIANHRPIVEGRIEVVETIMGKKPAFTHVEFSNSPCGGIRLDVGHHYVVLTSQVGTRLRLVPADNSIIWIEREYIPGFDSQNHRNPFLKSVLAYARGEADATAIDPFPNIERNGAIRRIDCNPCRLESRE